MRCCICGNKITAQTSHNPWPVRASVRFGSEIGRCCDYCNEEYVRPCRRAAILLDTQQYRELHKQIRTLDVEDIAAAIKERGIF